MDIKITFKNIKHTPAIDSRIEKKSKRLEKFFDGRSSIQWTCYEEGDLHIAEITVEGPTFRFMAKASDRNLYHALDKTINKMEIQVKKQKEKMKNPIHQKNQDFKFTKGREEALDEMVEETQSFRSKKKAS